MDRVMNCQLLQDESDRPQMNYRPHLNNQPLNFTTNPDDCDVQAARKAKTPRDPMSHRIIEKRRRDRMNNCLADLSRLIPANDMKQGQGRIEKTEIIEMAIKHIRQLKTRLQAHEASKTANPVEQSFPSANCHLSSCCSEKFYMGFKECQAELMRFLVENEGWNAKDQICNRLHKQLDEASQKYKGNFSAPEAFGSESKKEGASPQPSVYSASEYASGEHYNSPAPSSVYESDLIDLATYKSSNCHNFSLSQDKHLHMLLAKSNSSNTENESGVATMIPSTDYSGDMLSPEKLSSKSQGSDSERREVCGSIGSGHRYKFKQNITLRFSEEKRKASDSSSNSSSENNKVKVRRKMCKTKSPSPESDSSIYPPSDYSSNGNGSSYTSDTQTPPKMHGDHKDVKEEFPLKEAHLPGFLLHPLGSFYFPITLSESQVSKLGYLPYADSPQQSHNFLHPISIPVNFGSHLVTLRNINVKSDYRNATKVCCVEQMDSSNA